MQSGESDMIYGIGIDLVDIDRMERIMERWGKTFLNRICTDGEIGYCSRRTGSAGHYAARFAAKEAFLKSLGMGLFEGVGFKDVEVIVMDSGKPELRLHGKAATIVRERGLSKPRLSLSHTIRTAAAIVILEKADDYGR